MCPLNEVEEELFVGFLPKNTKRHEIFFSLGQDPSQDLPSFLPKNTLIELRSLRIKDKFDPISSCMLLFPDACTITLNRHLIKEILPIHKLSSLKYRQDETVKIAKNYLKAGTNNMSIV